MKCSQNQILSIRLNLINDGGYLRRVLHHTEYKVKGNRMQLARSLYEQFAPHLCQNYQTPWFGALLTFATRVYIDALSDNIALPSRYYTYTM